jgi:MFS transporter, DHA2 family, multidrug resistance protein
MVSAVRIEKGASRNPLPPFVRSRNADLIAASKPQRVLCFRPDELEFHLQSVQNPVTFPAAGGTAPVNKWLVTVSVTFGTLMGTIDASIVNVAVPHLRGSLGATVEEITWVTTGFVIANVVVMPLTAFLGHLFGQKRVYMAALAIFILSSALCGLAGSLTTLVAFRFLQGLGAGALQPTEQAILRQTFPPKEQGMAMAVFGMAVVIGPAVGPTLGGYIVDNYSWPWIFFINVPVGILALTMVSSFVHEPEDIRATQRAMAAKRRANLDWLGIALLSIGLAALQYVLEEGNRDDWFDSRVISTLSLVSFMALATFVVRELTAVAPAVDIMLFKDSSFTAGTLVSGVMFALLMAVTFLLPVFLQEVLGYTATQSGLALMPRALIMMVVTPIVGRTYNSVSPRLVVGFGVISVAVSTWMMSHYTLATSEHGIVAALLVQGLGFSCLFVPLATTALSRIPRHKLADAAGLNSVVRFIGGSMGLAIFATLLTRHMTTVRSVLGTHVVAGSPTLLPRLYGAQRMFSQMGMNASAARAGALRVVAGALAQQSAVIAFEQVFLLTGLSFLCVLPLVYFLKRAPHHAPSDAAGPPVHVEM